MQTLNALNYNFFQLLRTLIPAKNQKWTTGSCDAVTPQVQQQFFETDKIPFTAMQIKKLVSRLRDV